MAWYDDGWGRRKSLTVDSTLVPSDQTNFPLLVSVVDTDLRDFAQSSGNDILFTDTDEVTKLSHEIESYDSGTGTLVAWVKVPTLTSASDKVLYLYFKNAGASDQSDVANTWVGFESVWHMEEDPSGTAPQLIDSTSSSQDLTTEGSMASGDLVTGQTSNGIRFDGTQGATASTSQSDVFTVSAWINAATGVDEYHSVISKGSVFEVGSSIAFGVRIRTSVTQERTYIYRNAGSPTGVEINISGGILGQGWMYVAATYDDAVGVGFKLFQNGVQVGTNTTNLVVTDTGNVNVARPRTIAGSDSRYDGTIDEARIHTVVRDADWLLTEFNNQDAPGSFITVGTLEEGGSLVVGFTFLLRRRRRTH